MISAVHDKFAQALRGRLSEQEALQPGVGAEVVTPAWAVSAGLDAAAVAAATAEALFLPFLVELGESQVRSDFVAAVPIAFARRHKIVAFDGPDGQARLALAELAQWPQVQIMQRLLGRSLQPVFAAPDEIVRVVNAAYQAQSGQAQQTIQEIQDEQVLTQLGPESGNEDLLDVASRAPVIKLVNLLLLEAIKRRASDIHIQPYENRLMVRVRVDGVLYDVFEPPKNLQEEIISRIKIMGQMNIAERRLAQDGRASVEVGKRVVDLRIATLPTSFGERAVIRLLEKSFRYGLADLGMPAEVLERFVRLIRQDHGIMLVSGPTGSGKSTTLYAALQEINSQELNILTLEDPIEYRLEGVSQTQVSDKKGMTFASGLRHVLRQDPDVIMVGEIRDGETAHMAIQSALTGHLVFSTLHTNDAAGSVARMLDLGVEPYLLASSLLGILSQRLVRRICPRCKQPYQPSPAELEQWGLRQDCRPRRLFKGAGCAECLNTGYQGRGGIFELMVVTEPVRELILQRAKASSIHTQAVRDGMGTIQQDGLAKAEAGLTTLEEIYRVAGVREF